MKGSRLAPSWDTGLSVPIAVGYWLADIIAPKLTEKDLRVLSTRVKDLIFWSSMWLYTKDI
jgi:hypothetical protein